MIVNPSADQTPEDLSTLISYGATLGEQLSREAVAFLKRPVVSFGKAALIGTNGDIEHGAAIMHPKMGMSMRAIIGGGKAIIPSNVKIGAAGTTIDVRLGHRDNPWSFDEIDTLTYKFPVLHDPMRSDRDVDLQMVEGRGRELPLAPLPVRFSSFCFDPTPMFLGATQVPEFWADRPSELDFLSVFTPDPRLLVARRHRATAL